MGSKPCKPVVDHAEASGRLTRGEHAEFERTFKSLSARGDLSSKIPKESFLRFAQERFPDASPAVHNRVMDAFDTDGNGSVDFGEFVAGMFVFRHGTPNERLRFVFNMFDLDGDLFISRKEMKKMAAAFVFGNVPDSWTVEVEVAEEPVRTVQETVNVKTYKPVVDMMVEAAMLTYDADSDGKLSFEEWLRYADDSDHVQSFVRAIAEAGKVEERVR